ncbi:hypothetical protein SDC9_172939 [bioreactor metagenome]|uniref:Uncharacterized protein n=1 Tax=bioreactor metagenome TaxID=1076179 RepID=A0A645GF32_9ZZZZ
MVRRVVTVVFTILANVLLELKFTFSAGANVELSFLFSRIRSKTIIVLLIEYPRMVRIAATRLELTGIWKMEYNVSMMNTS